MAASSILNSMIPDAAELELLKFHERLSYIYATAGID